jgi:putative membrane protein
METIGWVLAALAGLLHVYIFVLEALRFDDPGTRAVFRIEPEHADAVRPWAWNQGWYNLFLAVGALAGAGFGLADHDGTSVPLVVLACGSMTAAALVLVLTDRRMQRSALLQGTIPTLALLALALG